MNLRTLLSFDDRPLKLSKIMPTASIPMNRREFLASSATVAAAPMLLGMTHKASEDNPVIGEKAWKYECHHNWGKLPGELVWQTTHGTAVDSQGLIYITHQGAGKKQLDTVIAFDDKGKY